MGNFEYLTKHEQFVLCFMDEPTRPIDLVNKIISFKKSSSKFRTIYCYTHHTLRNMLQTDLVTEDNGFYLLTPLGKKARGIVTKMNGIEIVNPTHS